jgi:r1t holin
MYTAAFWTGAFDRAIKSLAQTLILLWFTSDVVNLFEVNWVQSLGVGAGALVLSLLTSIVSAPVGDRGSTSVMRGGN